MTVYRDRTTKLYRYHFEHSHRRYTQRGFATKRAAQDAEAARRLAVATGAAPTEPYPTARDLVAAFLTTSERTKSADWTRQLRWKLNRGFAALADLRPRDVSTAHVDACLTRLAAEHRSARSLNEYRKIIIAVLSYGVRAGALESNVAARIPKVPEPERAIEPIPRAHL